MAGSRQGVPDLRIGVPTLEPDPAFVAQLASLAAAAGAPGAPVAARPRPHYLKVALAAASVAAITTGGAWASGTLVGNDGPTPPSAPVNRPTAPVTTPSGPTHEEGASDDPAPEGSARGTDPHVARPDDRPAGSPGEDTPQDDTGPAGVPLPSEDADEQQEPADDRSDPSGTETREDADRQDPGDAGGDLDTDDQTTGDDGSQGPDPSGADG